jgi:hypothetical protein
MLSHGSFLESDAALALIRTQAVDGLGRPRTLDHPSEQVLPETSRLVTLVNGMLHVLLPEALLLRQDIQALKLRFELLLALSAWDEERTRVRSALSLMGMIPVTDVEYEQLLQKERAAYLPLPVAAEVLALVDGRRRAGSWYRREARRLANAGLLRSRSGRRRVEIEVGSLYDYLERTDEPDSSTAPRRKPASRRDFEHDWWRAIFAARGFDDQGKAPDMAPLVTTMVGPSSLRAGGRADEVRDAMTMQVRNEALKYWSRLLAIETVLGEIVQVFQDEGVVPWTMSSLLARARRGLQDLYAQGNEVLELGAFPPADAEFAEQLRQEASRYHTVYL